jgi:hypothetical protein
VTEHRWTPKRGDAGRIRAHLDRQAGVDPDFVRLDDGRVVPVGSDAEGEGPHVND